MREFRDALPPELPARTEIIDGNLIISASDRTVQKFFESLSPDIPLRTEIIDGNLIVSPFGTPRHARIARILSRALIPVEDANGWESFDGNVDICIEGPRDAMAPDYCIVPLDAPLWGGREILSSGVIMVAEVVSPGSTRTDHLVKPGVYAGCGIPIMMIIDPVSSPPAVTVLSDPEDGAYRTAVHAELGKPVRIPDPVDFDLDTSIFL
ncbi:Uma2 family endonuclease [Streptosporangium sandarakinum]|uniref:Uma2 family endonuclease n=1 Tax=Streptosporangium sandarakinum TaxID=1260955 RepID=A0A852VB44_9ACTN|nr:Uma2 family endonuclease [Streptosporangium sandarakinum]NYF43335.1 Uma2 family endonuclease [Streptosporangium sandarakinum]